MYIFEEIFLYLIVAKSLSHPENLEVLNTSYIQHVIHKKKDFITFKPYTGDLIARIGETKIQSSS